MGKIGQTKEFVEGVGRRDWVSDKEKAPRLFWAVGLLLISVLRIAGRSG